ncbi:hypothetical protein FSARC_8812 [Fusarium sarcochroum]|uniref:Azaphilone pigments biosynthesis cluster protein L N-terminal domain-containing protein n=1 Tax=Fusarium sarcochroum TaxID=1208366 RepID=A0A8H4TSG4_9HYPO|nr:hypothetical protein FSARC_8812 [Fusarium sarcochroum]
MNRAIEQAVALQKAIESFGGGNTSLIEAQSELETLVDKLGLLKVVGENTTISFGSVEVPIARCDQLCYHITSSISGKSSRVGTTEWTLQDMISLLSGYCATIPVALEYGIRKANLTPQESNDRFNQKIQLVKERLECNLRRFDDETRLLGGANENPYNLIHEPTNDKAAISACLKICEEAELFTHSSTGETRSLCLTKRSLPTKSDAATEEDKFVPKLHDTSKCMVSKGDSSTPGYPSPRESVELTPGNVACQTVFRVGTAIANRGSQQLILQTRNSVMAVESVQAIESSQFVGSCDEMTVQEVLKHLREGGPKDDR